MENVGDIPGGWGKPNYRPTRRSLVGRRRRRRSPQCRPVSGPRHPCRPHRPWPCHHRIGRPRIPTYTHTHRKVLALLAFSFVVILVCDGSFSFFFRAGCDHVCPVQYRKGRERREREGGPRRKKVTYSLNLTRVDLDDTNAGSDQFPSQGFGKGPHGGFRGAIDASTGVTLSAGDAADVDDVAAAAVLASVLFQKDGHHGLGHVDQTRHVGGEHDLHVFGLDVRGSVHSPDQAGVVDQDVNVSELGRQVGHEPLDLLRLRNVELDGQHLDPVTDLLGDLGRDRLQRVDAPGRDDDLEVLWAGPGEFLGDRLADPRTGSRHQDRLALEAFGHGRERHFLV